MSTFYPVCPMTKVMSSIDPVKNLEFTFLYESDFQCNTLPGKNVNLCSHRIPPTVQQYKHSTCRPVDLPKDRAFPYSTEDYLQQCIHTRRISLTCYCPKRIKPNKRTLHRNKTSKRQTNQSPPNGV